MTNVDKRTWSYEDPIFKKMYQEERDKFSPHIDADTDFQALHNALKRYRSDDLI